MTLLKPNESFHLAGCYLEITSKCNLRCLHCYNESGVLVDLINKDTFLRIINDLPNNPDTSVTLSGGEPTTHPEFWEFLDELKQRNFGKTLVITNGTFINEDVAQKFAQYDIGIQISLNGSSSETHDKLCGKGSFERTMRGFNNLLNAGLSKNIIVRSVLSNFNKTDIIPLIKMLAQKNIRQIEIAALSALGRSKDNLPNLSIDMNERFNLIQDWKTNADIKKIEESGLTINFPDDFTDSCPLLSQLTEDDEKLPLTPRVDSSGNVFLCQLFTDVNYSIGNVSKLKVSEMIQTQKLSNLIEFFRLGQKYIHECQKCVWKGVCGKGCIAMAVANGGTVQDTDGNCAIRKKYFLSELRANNRKPVLEGSVK